MRELNLPKIFEKQNGDFLQNSETVLSIVKVCRYSSLPNHAGIGV